jgi:hypothetical protein
LTKCFNANAAGKESLRIEGVDIRNAVTTSALIDDVEHVFAYAIFLGK